MTLPLLRALCMASAVLAACGLSLAQVPTDSQPEPCSSLPHDDHPRAFLRNDNMKAVVFLPDVQNGYYRGARFDWSGVIGCVALRGHEFFGEWFNRYDPLGNDSITGPAEEFRHPTSELGYDDAEVPRNGMPGGEFLKIGVGILRRIDDKPYSFGKPYTIADHGTWTVKAKGRSITFRQVLRSEIGYSYIYEKTLSLDRHGHVLTLHHSLRNTGAKPLDTAVYNHDFFMVDHQPIDAGTEVRFPFVPVMDHPLPATAMLKGKTIEMIGTMQPRQGIGAYVTGFSASPADFDFTFENTALGAGVQETSDRPLTKMYLWGTPRTLCPEGYIAIHVAPSKSQSWTLRFRFFAK